MKIKKRKILVFAAHPDDEILGCGGSAAKWVTQGHDVHFTVNVSAVPGRAL